MAEAEISGIDLSGNGIVIVPGKMFIYRSGEPNKFRSSEPIKNIYRGSSSIVARTLLIRQEYSTVNEVLDEIVKRRGKPTLGTVSKVLKSLENDLLISRNQGVRLIDATGLLTKLRGNYRQPKQQRRIVGKIDRLDNALTKISENCDRNEVSCAVDEPRRYAVFPTVGVPTRIFTENINKALDGIDFEETDRFPNVELIETPEPAVYFDRRCSLSDGVYYTSPLQTYLDLTTGGKREIETAEQIAKKLLKFEYS